jgi:hypothetical protein
VREYCSSLSHLPKLSVHSLYCIGSIHHSTDYIRILKEGR